MRLLFRWVLLPFVLSLALLRFVLLLPFPRRVPPYATLRLQGPLPWRHMQGTGRKLRRRKPSIEELEEGLEALQREPALRGLIVRVEGLRAGPARREAVAQALARFRASGKEVVVYWKQASGADTFLLPVADKVFLAPAGAVLLLGTAATLTGLRGLLDRLGVLPEFVRAGGHKTAPELFTNREPSDEQRQLVDSVLDHRWERLLDEVAARRGGDRAWAREVIDGGPYTSRRAVEAGLVDELLYADELPARLGGVGGGRRWPAQRAFPSASAVLASRKWRLRPQRLLPAPRVAVVRLSGVIKGGHSSNLPWSPAAIGEESAVRWLDAARKDASIRAVLVIVDSRGGLASASDWIRRALARLSEKKPTVAYVENVAASGGYMIASAARRIVVAPGALVGSIGAFSGRLSAEGLLEQLGIHQELRTRGANAGLLSGARPLEAHTRASLERELDQVYTDFLEQVALGRRVPVEAIRPHAEGRVFLGSQAPAVLVDEVGDFRAALAWLCKEAGTTPAEVELVQKGRGKLGLRLGLRRLRDFTEAGQEIW